MKWFIARLLRRIGLLRFDLLGKFVETYPDSETLKPDELVVVEDANVKKWGCFLCPGGCGAPISLSLNPQRRPRWRILLDFWARPTVEPSVHQTN